MNIDSESNLRQVNVSWVTARWPVKVCSNLTKIEMYKRYVVRWGPADSTDVESMTITSLEGTAIFSVVRRGKHYNIHHLFILFALSFPRTHSLIPFLFILHSLFHTCRSRTHSLSFCKSLCFSNHCLSFTHSFCKSHSLSFITISRSLCFSRLRSLSLIAISRSLSLFHHYFSFTLSFCKSISLSLSSLSPVHILPL